MAHPRKQRRYLTALGVGVITVVLIGGFVWFVRTMMGAKSTKSERQVQIVQVIRPPPPPPPPPPDQPPPPPEKTEEPLPKDQPEPPPDQEPPPAAPLGVDADGSAGSDAFGLAARHGGSDLVGGNGSAVFAWYTNRVKDAILDKLSTDMRIHAKKFSVSLRLWVGSDGSIKRVKLSSTTGNSTLDQTIESDLGSLARLSEGPPVDMPQPITVEIVSRS
jgi:periplasmic protein TonB